MKNLGAAAGWLGSAAIGGWRKSVAAVQDSGIVDQIRDNTAALVTKTGEVTRDVVTKVTDEQFIAQQKERISVVSKNVVDSSTDWFSQLTAEKDPNEDFDPFADLKDLKSTSTGSMSGFGGAPAVEEKETVAGNLQKMSTGKMQGFGGGPAPAPAYPTGQAAPKEAAKKNDIWSDDNWGEDF
jgi:hypothetical protein